MYITDPMRLPAGNECQHSYKNPPFASRFRLVHSDRVGLERLLSLGLVGKCALRTRANSVHTRRRWTLDFLHDNGTRGPLGQANHGPV